MIQQWNYIINYTYWV